MAERIAFKGMTPSQAALITHEQYLELICSRNRRSIKRNSMDYRKLMGKVEKFKKNNVTKAVRTHLREAVILPSWIGVKFEVHDGKEFKQLVITANMLDHRLGEYAYSTKRVLHSAPGIRATRGSKFLAVK
jgi:small subunit ribosomal protein S19